MENRNIKPLAPSMPGVSVMTKWLYAAGGQPQQHRMIKDKKRTLDRAVLYSYQGAFVKDTYKDMDWVRCLINPNKLKQDYDDKVISIDYKWDFKPGTIFEWRDTNSRWLIYLQDLTELAYFRGDIRRCRYDIQWIDKETGAHCQTYAAIRGPVETKIDYLQKNSISLDTPNYSLNFLVPYNEDNYKFFKRYTRFYLQEDTSICWRVEAVNSISSPGIIEIVAVEYYSNKDIDDIENGLPEAKLIDLEADTSSTYSRDMIQGETFIKTKISAKYTCPVVGIWSVDKKYPVELKQIDDNTVELKWIQSYSGQFELYCGDYSKTIVVESLF